MTKKGTIISKAKDFAKQNEELGRGCEAPCELIQIS